MFVFKGLRVGLLLCLVRRSRCVNAELLMALWNGDRRGKMVVVSGGGGIVD